MTALAHAGVTPDYCHIEKLAQARPGLVLGDTTLKWYDVAADDAPVPLAVRAIARRSLRDAGRAGELGALGELGFVVLHRCGEDFYFLLICTWRNENELWETVWAKDGANDALFRPWPAEEPHRPTYCVWELGVVSHERTAWSDFLRSRRDGPARTTYLHACFDGVV